MSRVTTTTRSPVLRTKLAPPPPRPGLVDRPDLVARLDEPAPARLTVVSAPAGWGKTTLLAEWVRRAPGVVAWVSLDPSDNDPARFWGYVTQALSDAGVPADAAPLALGGADTALAEFFADVETAGAPVAIVLDDYHCIDDPSIHATLGLLVEHAPAGIRIVVGTRSEPPLGLPRLRVRGDLIELRAADLRVDPGHAGQLVRAAALTDLDDDAVASLHRRTEGWAAGLYLAGLSLRGRSDAAEFVSAFAGDDRLVVDYLASEVLGALPEDRRAFLLRSSILGRLNGPLCDAVTGRSDSQAVLTELEGSNLFLVPLDSRRGWYRFHHLFGELLRHELTLGGDAHVRDLHLRAAEWLRAHGHVDEAIQHLAAARETDAAADLIAQSWSVFHMQGWIASIERWLALLPESRVLGDARLCLAGAWAAISLGRVDTASRWIAAAEEALDAADAPRELVANLAMARAIERMSLGDTQTAIAAGHEALRLEDGPDSQWRSVACLAVGMAYYHTMDHASAYRALRESVEVGERTGIPIPPLVALCVMADMDLDRGDLAAAETNSRRALEHAETESHSRFPHAGAAHSSLAVVHAAHGRHDDARVAADRGVELTRRGRMGPQISHALLSRARVRLADGDIDGARDDLRQARSAAELGGGRPPDNLAHRLRQVEAMIAVEVAASPPAPDGALTDRERTVLAMLAGPSSLREIAAELSVSPNTVKTQVRAIYRKLGVGGRTDAVEAARRLGLSARR
jgi:LuxR family maltose regulon positive regulatory protein